ncbi:MAG: hypothetical protein KJO26_09530 [Deltaproteobacteria bacterium]|nr:hypothetical protein [Deltaproteobacteria bacterium]
MKLFLKPYTFLFLSVILVLTACSHRPDIQKELKAPAVYVAAETEKSLSHSFAPVFLIADTNQSYNKIGSPSARYNSNGKEVIFIDINHPAVYFSEKKFKTESGEYTNLNYRIHFPKIPGSLFPFHLTAGKNVGLMVVVTLNSNQKPVLITAVHTCGCYLAFIPTSFLHKGALPKKWNTTSQKVYGETLPGMLDYEGKNKPKLLVYLRSAIHRVADIRIVESDTLTDVHKFSMPVLPMDRLDTIPLNGKSTSLFHQKGILKGYVKGSIKYWETIFLSLISLDFFVGTDKAYKDTDETENHFYTSLKPWNRSSSDMWHFDRFLKFWGWRL